MGCMQVCEDQTKKRTEYAYSHQLKFIKETISQIIYFKANFNHQFVTKCYQQICHKPRLFILDYPKKIEQKQSIPVNILQKWKLILYGSGYEDEHYIECLEYNKTSFQKDKIKQDRTFKLQKQNPFQINLKQLYYHQSYTQIQKDIVRKYEIPELKQESFERILKKISNYFPSTGYALGINYIIGYFLIIGYSQIDSLWLFIHLALNKRFLALGLFEQGFPLAKILILIFKNILKRTNRTIYQNIFQKMLIDDSTWILKWFMSFYLSSFPIQVCQFIWDITLGVGILGLVYFGVSLVQILSDKILTFQDEGDIIMFFKSLNNFQNFNDLISIQKVMGLAYSFSIQFDDFQGIQTLKNDFYVKYFSLLRQTTRNQNNKGKLIEDQNFELKQFYLQILKDRQKFTNLARQSATKFYQLPTTQRQSPSSERQFQISQQQKQKSQKYSKNKDKIQQLGNDNKENQIKVGISFRVQGNLYQKQQKIGAFEDKNKALQKFKDNIIRRVKSQNFQTQQSEMSYKRQYSQGHFISEEASLILKDTAQKLRQPQEKQRLSPKISKEDSQIQLQNLQLNKQLSYITNEVGVRSVKNQKSFSSEYQESQDEIDKIQEFANQNIVNSKKKVKFKPQEQVKDTEKNYQVNQKLQLRSAGEDFLKGQINQGYQSQWHISIYNIQDQKIGLSQRGQSCQKVKVDQGFSRQIIDKQMEIANQKLPQRQFFQLNTMSLSNLNYAQKQKNI